MREGARCFVPRIGTGNRRHAFAPLDPAADPVDQTGLDRRLGEVAIACLEPGRHIARHPFDIGLRARAANVGLPFLPQCAIELGVVLARLGRHFIERVGLDSAFVGPDTEHVRVYAQAFEQARVIELLSARSGDRRAAHRVDPHLARMRGEHGRIVGIGDGIGEDGLLGLPEAVERLADRLHMDMPAAEEGREVERDRLDALVPGRLVDRPDDVARGILAGRNGRRQQHVERIDRGDFLDHAAIERQQQRPFANRARTRPRHQDRKQRGEEQQQEQQRQRVLDSDQQAPDFACKTHWVRLEMPLVECISRDEHPAVPVETGRAGEIARRRDSPFRERCQGSRQSLWARL